MCVGRECYSTSEKEKLASIQSGQERVWYGETLILKPKKEFFLVRGECTRLKEWRKKHYGDRKA